MLTFTCCRHDREDIASDKVFTVNRIAINVKRESKAQRAGYRFLSGPLHLVCAPFYPHFVVSCGRAFLRCYSRVAFVTSEPGAAWLLVRAEGISSSCFASLKRSKIRRSELGIRKYTARLTSSAFAEVLARFFSLSISLSLLLSQRSRSS